jgi:hypothetical protein
MIIGQPTTRLAASKTSIVPIQADVKINFGVVTCTQDQILIKDDNIHGTRHAMMANSTSNQLIESFDQAVRAGYSKKIRAKPKAKWMARCTVRVQYAEYGRIDLEGSKGNANG